MKMLIPFILLMSLFFPLANANAQQVSIQPLVEFTATTVSAEALSADSSRKYLLVQNRGTASVLLKFDSAHTGSEGIEIIAGGNYELTSKVPTNKFYIKAVSGSQPVYIYPGR